MKEEHLYRQPNTYELFFFLLSVDILNFANNTLGGLVVGNIDANSSLAEAERILKELKNRNFSEVMKNGDREESSANNVTTIVKKLMEQAMELQQKAGKFNNTFKNLLEAFQNLKKESGLTKGDSINATVLVTMAKNIDYKVRLFLNLYFI